MFVRRAYNLSASGEMMTAVLLAGLLTVGVRAQSPAPIFDPPLSPRIANYEIDVTLDDKAKRTSGRVTLNWRNPSDRPVDELQFHLYYNAFKNAKSTFLRESLHASAVRSDDHEPSKKNMKWKKDDDWGSMGVTRMTVDGVDVTDNITFYQADDGNPDDESVIRVLLPGPIAARAQARIEMDFEAALPKCNVRTGWWHDDFFMMAQWFPKIGVYETPGMRFVPRDISGGRWNCHQFHAGTEFYADYGVYDVRMTVPTRYLIGSSGLILSEEDNGDGTKTVVAHAEDVHDFAWVADGQAQEIEVIWRSQISDREISIRLLYQPDHQDLVDKYLQSVVYTLNYIENWLGPDAYPYPNLTVLDPRRGSGAGGMEYPTLITGGGSWLMEKVFGDGLRLTELVTIHEFMHQIWYGIVGNNEFEEAWLDEGLTTYSETRISGDRYGRDRTILDWVGLTAGVNAMLRRGYAFAKSRNDAAIADPTFDHWYTGVGGPLSYNKTALMLITLENYLGREQFDKIMRSYYRQWRFEHPSRESFVNVANRAAGENLDWFFDQVLRDASELDYAVAAVANVPFSRLEAGTGEDDEDEADADDDDLATNGHETAGDEEAGEESDHAHLVADRQKTAEGEEADDTDEDDEPEQYDSSVVFRRVGEVVFPMDVLIEFSDGEIVRERWDGRDRTKTYRFTRPAKIVRAAIDPDYKVPLDVDRLNNSLRLDPDGFVQNKYTLKGFFWMQSLLQWFSILG